jgi:hypothetical protein
VVRGRLWLRTAGREGGAGPTADLEAFAAGHNLAHGTAAFRRVSRVPATHTQVSQKSPYLNDVV